MNFEEIKALIEVLDKSSVAKLKIKNEHFSLELDKQSATVISAAPVAAPVVPVSVQASSPVNEKSEELSGEKLLSPMVGTFYRSPSPDSPVFVNEGDTVKAGQTIAILEAMKIMNEFEAEFNCKILKVLVEDGQAVEYDMPLFLVERL